MADEKRLYGILGAEHMYFDPGAVYEIVIEPWGPEAGGQRIIEEWSVLDPISHVPSAERIAEWISEVIAEEGELVEDGWEAWNDIASLPDVVAAIEGVRTLMASKVKFRMADRHLGDHTVSWDAAGDPLYDGEPLYVPRPS